jgi:hypothetical protein
MAQQTAADGSNEPEISDARLRSIADDILDACDDHFALDRNVDSLHVAQLDEPWCDDSPEIRFMLRTDGGSTMADIINGVNELELPLTLDSTNPGHGQLTFHVDD